MATRWYIVDLRDANGRTSLVLTNASGRDQLIREMFEYGNMIYHPGTFVEVSMMGEEIFEMNDRASVPLLVIEV